MSIVPTLVAALCSDVAAQTPGRTALLCEIRVSQLLGSPLPAELDGHPLVEAARQWPGDPTLTDGERVVLGIAEQFTIDVHGISDGAFAQLLPHYSSAEVVALVMHLGLLNGFIKLARTTGAR